VNAPAIVGAGKALADVDAAAAELKKVAATLPAGDDVRLLAAGIESSTVEARDHIGCLPSIAAPAALRLGSMLADATSVVRTYAAFLANGRLGEVEPGQAMTNGDLLSAVVNGLADAVAGQAAQLARIRASEARIAAVRALQQYDVEWTPTAPAPVVEQVQRPPKPTALVVALAFVVVAAIWFIGRSIFGAFFGPDDATAHALAPLLTTWSLT
jgi:hypothetical protein